MTKNFHPGVTVVIPTITPRTQSGQSERAAASAWRAIETLRIVSVPGHIVMPKDVNRKGAAHTRQDGLERVKTEWAAFLDDDDTMDPDHLLRLFIAANESHADYLWSRFRIGLPDGSTRPGPAPLGAGTFDQWNDDQPAQTTVTTLVRTELALDVGGFTGEGDAYPYPAAPDGQRSGEDWMFTLACRAAGAVFRHVPHVTWTWSHHGANTSGLPDRW